MNPLLHLLSVDRLKVAELESIYQRERGRMELVAYAVSAMNQLDPATLWRALWLLRRAAADSVVLSEELLRRVIEMADGFDHWVARLIFCQLMSALELPPSLRDEAVPMLFTFAEDPRAIVRAWAVSSLFPLRRDPEFGPRIRRLITRSKKEKSKAIQARIRRLEHG